MRQVALFLSISALFWSAAPDAVANSGVFGCPIMIDDFTQGALPPANGPFDFTHLGLPPQSCAGGSRRVVINDVATHSAGMVLLGGGDLGFKIDTEEHAPGNNVIEDADVVLQYDMPAPTDLTDGGKNDRLILDVVSVSFISVFVRFEASGGASGKTILLQPGQNSMPLSQVLVDVTQIERISFYFHEYSTSGFGELTLRRIRVTGSSRKDLFLDLPEWVAVGPPFPLFGPLMHGRYLDDEGVELVTPALGLNLDTALVLPFGAAYPVESRASDSASDGGPFGTAAGFEIFDSNSLLADGEFRFSVNMWSDGESRPGRITIDPELLNPPGGDMFVLPFDVETLDDAENPTGSLAYRLRVQLSDAAGYEIGQAMIYPPDPIDDPSFRFHFELQRTRKRGAEAKGSPALFEISLEGDRLPLSLATSAPSHNPGTGLRLSAAPSVVSHRTTLWLSQARSHEVALGIYDLAGRLVRRLSVTPGQRSVAWDSRDDSGRAVSSGAYLVRVNDGDTVATNRVSVVR